MIEIFWQAAPNLGGIRGRRSRRAASPGTRFGLATTNGSLKDCSSSVRLALASISRRRLVAQSGVDATHGSIRDCTTARAPTALFGCARGHRVARGARVLVGPSAHRWFGCSPASRSAASSLGRRSLERVRGPVAAGSGDAYWAVVSFAASKHSPFFHNVRTNVAILRATVSVASCGLIPLASIAA